MNKYFFSLFTLFLVLACNNSATLEQPAGKLIIDKEDSAKRAEKLKAEVLEAGKPYWIEAKKQVMLIESYINLAEDGTISKSEVVREFNNTVGATMGRLNSFEKVKERIKEAGDGYVEYVYNRACAEIATQRAAELKFEIEKK